MRPYHIFHTNMPDGNAWNENESLIDSLKRYVEQNLKRIEIIDYMKRVSMESFNFSETFKTLWYILY